MRKKQESQSLREKAVALVAQVDRLGLNHRNEFAAILRDKLSGADCHIDPSDIAHLQRLIEIDLALSQNERIDTVEPYRPQPTQDELGYGDFILPFSVLETNAKFSPSYEHLIRGSQIMAAVGFGKTTTAKHLLSGSLRQGVPAVIFDSKGKEFDDLQTSFPVLLLKVGKDFYSNPFEGSLESVLQQMDILATCTGRQDSRVLLSRAAKLFFENPELSKDHCLTFSKLEQLLPQAKPPPGFPGFNPKLIQSMLAVTSSIQDSALGHVFRCERGIDFNSLIRSGISLVLDTSDLSLPHEEILISSIGWKIYEMVHEMFSSGNHQLILAVIYIDEATSHVSSELDRPQRHLGPLAGLILKSRGGNLAILLSFHSASSVSTIITANAHVTFVGHQLSEQDMRTVKHACALTPGQTLSLPHLGVGEFMVKLGSGYTFPFLIRVDPIRHIHLSQEEIEKRNAALLARLPKIEPEREFKVSDVKDIPSKQQDQQSLAITILKDIHAHKSIGVTARFKSLKFNGKRIPLKLGERTLAQLEKDGLIESVSLRLSLKGRATDLYFLTESGYKAIGSPGDRLVPRGGTSLRHCFLQEYCVQKILHEQDIKATAEAERNGKCVDVGFRHKNIFVGLEIGLSTEKTEPKQAKADLEAGWDKVIVVFKDRETCKRAVPGFEQELEAATGNSVTLVEFWHLAKFPVEVIYNHGDFLFNHKEYLTQP